MRFLSAADELKLILKIKDLEVAHMGALLNPPRRLAAKLERKLRRSSCPEPLRGLRAGSCGELGAAAVRESEQAREYATRIGIVLSANPMNEEEACWATKVRSAARAFNAARNELLKNSNVFIRGQAIKYQKVCLSSSHGDLIQEASLGLLRALDKFEPDRGYRFHTYAVWWIRHHIRRAVIDKDKMIRIPVHRADKLATIQLLSAKVKAETGVELTMGDVAARTGMTRKEVEKVLGSVPKVKSLDVPVVPGEPDSPTRLDLLVDDGPMPDEALFASVAEDAVHKAMQCLTPRERRVIYNRFGIGRAKVMTLQEIAITMGVTRERIRQIELDAKAKLRKSPATRAYQESFA